MPKLYWNSLFLSLLISLNSKGQSFSSADLALLNQIDCKVQSATFPYRPFSLTGKNALAKYNPIKIVAASGLYFYQNVISKQIGSNCPYHHSCSGFSKMCIAKYGLIKGVFLTGDRLMRCTPFGLKDIQFKSDINPVSKRIIDDPSFYE